MSIILTNGRPRGQSIALDRRARVAILYSVHPCAAFAPIPAPPRGKTAALTLYIHAKPYLYIYTRLRGALQRARLLRRTSVRAELTNLYSLTGKLPSDTTAL